MSKKIHWSYGGGNQSIAIAILIKMGLLPVPHRTIMADTGGEMTEVWDYTEKYVKPLLGSIGVTLEIAPHSLSSVDFYSEKEHSLLIPAFTQTGKLPTFCSKEWKALVVRRYIGGHEANPDGIIMWLGMSTNEIHRMKPSDKGWIEHHWPLCDMPVSAGYGVRMNRIECRKLILDYGWPDPPSSACVWCPHLDNPQWQRMKKYAPQDFERAQTVQQMILDQDKKGGVWLHKERKDLDQVDFSKDEGNLFEGCETGYCMT